MQLMTEWYIKETRDNDEEVSHRVPDEEAAFYQAVCAGDLEAVRRNCAQKRFSDMTGAGILSRDPLQNFKYHFVVTAALLTRTCVNAGLEPERAFRLSDFYILKLDGIHAERGVVELHEQMVLDFAGKMRQVKKSSGTSKPISACVDHIYSHITQRLTVEDLAAHTGLSTGYLSRLFKQEMGISVSDYIREKKIEKAQNLLKYTDNSLIEISNYLSFSSQSHFIQTFRKITGMTPKKYRDLNQAYQLGGKGKPDAGAARKE